MILHHRMEKLGHHSKEFGKVLMIPYRLRAISEKLFAKFDKISSSSISGNGLVSNDPYHIDIKTDQDFGAV